MLLLLIGLWVPLPSPPSCVLPKVVAVAPLPSSPSVGVIPAAAAVLSVDDDILPSSELLDVLRSLPASVSFSTRATAADSTLLGVCGEEGGTPCCGAKTGVTGSSLSRPSCVPSAVVTEVAFVVITGFAFPLLDLVVLVSEAKTRCGRLGVATQGLGWLALVLQVLLFIDSMVGKLSTEL